MKRFVIFVFTLMAVISVSVAAPLKIVATTPDLADLTRHVGGDWVEVESLAKGTEDIHAIPQRPSFVPKLHRAQAVVVLGLDAEHAFLPALLDVAQNPQILPGHPGYIDCSVDIRPLDVPVVLSRSEGEQHPLGNPHYNIDPRNGALMARAIAAGLTRLDPAHRAAFEANEQAFEKDLSSHLVDWKKAADSLKGIEAVSHHPSMAYLADFLGLKMVGTIELKPGVPPTPRHLDELVKQMKTDHVPLIVREVQYSESTSLWLANQTGARVAVIATMGGAFPDSRTYIGMIDHNIKALLPARGQ